LSGRRKTFHSQMLLMVIATALLVSFVALALAASTRGRCDAADTACISRVVQRIDESFSAVPLGSAINPESAGLVLRGHPNCPDRPHECGYSDERGVRHVYYGPNLIYRHGIVLKAASVEDFVGRPIPALGIGLARSREEVTAAVRRFIPELTVDCWEVEANADLEISQEAHCLIIEAQSLNAPISITMSFDERDQLIGAYIDNRYVVD
jgi:hypothetical protein